MNVRLLDTRVSEAAVKRPPESPRRWGHRSDRNRTTGLVASVVAAARLRADDDVPNLATYRLPAATHLSGGNDSPLDYGDLRSDYREMPPVPAGDRYGQMVVWLMDITEAMNATDDTGRAAIRAALLPIAEQLAEVA